MMRLLRRRFASVRQDDSGTALVLALLVVLLVGTMLAAVLDYVRAGFELAPPVKEDRNESHYVQGAVEGAVNEIRGSSTSGRAGWPCPDFTPPAGTDAGVQGRTFLVTCEPQGVTGGSPDGMAQPDWAVQSLATPSRGIQQTGNGELTVDGGVYTAGDIAVAGGSANFLNVYGSLFARGACPAGNRLRTTDSALNCGYGGPSTVGADPAWPSAVDSQPRLESLISSPALADPEPTCNGGKITFGPGYYGQTPDALVQRYLPSCSSTLMHFTPGTYYFDYDGVWDLAASKHLTGNPPPPVKVVGGTAAAGLAGRPMGLACDPAADGVQFVFGGQSRLGLAGNSTNSGQGLELCGPTASQLVPYAPSGFAQRIALYGAKLGQGTPLLGAGTFEPATQATTSTNTTDAPVPLTADLVRVMDDSPALLLSRAGSTTSVELSGFGAQPPTLPPGAKIRKVTVEIAQIAATAADAPVINQASGTSTVALTAGTKTYATSAVAPATCPKATPCSVTVVDNGVDAPFWKDLSNLSLRYTFRSPNGANNYAGVLLDGFTVKVEYTKPTLRPLDCGATCTFLTSGSNPRLFLHGTYYTPTADADLRVHNNGDTIFSRGIIVRNLAVDMSASSRQENAPFQLPNATPGGRKVLFKGYVDGSLAVRACAVYDDKAPVDGGKFAGFPGWGVSVPKWTALRSPVDRNSCDGVAGP